MHTPSTRQTEMQKRKTRRDAWLVANGPCVLCGSSIRLEVDHVDPLDKVSHTVWSWSEKKRAEELLKCRVLCHSCHVERHAATKRSEAHGTASGYQRRHCRCELCREWAAKAKQRETRTIESHIRNNGRWPLKSMAEGS